MPGTSDTSGTSAVPPAPTRTSAPAGKGTKIGIILPDGSPRWADAQRAALSIACSAARLDCQVWNAEGRSATMAAIAKDLQNNGIRILVLTAVDAAAAVPIERAARANGVLTVEYLRRVANGDAVSYVGYDQTELGHLLAAGLRGCAQTGGHAYLRVDLPTGLAGGRTAAYRRSLAHAGWTVNATAVADSTKAAASKFRRMIENYPGTRAVLAASDGLAGGVVAVLRERHLLGRVAVSGEGATAAGLQRVLAGEQCFTVYEPPHAAADALVRTLVKLVDYRSVPSFVPVTGARIVRRTGVKAVVDDGYASRAAVCAGHYAAACRAAGI